MLKLGRGRKKDDPKNTNNYKYSSDNVIKAIKVKSNDYLIIKIIVELNIYKNKSNSKYIEVISNFC